MGGRIALLIGTGSFRDPSLPQLSTPAADVRELAALLRDPYLAGFDPVIELVDASMQQVGREIAHTLDRRKKDDLVLVYYSGQVLLDDEGQLHLAMLDTELDLLSPTSISASFVVSEMDRSRSRRQILVLDSRVGTGFAHGARKSFDDVTPSGPAGQLAAALPDAQDLAHAFVGDGRGRVVFAACEEGSAGGRRTSRAPQRRELAPGLGHNSLFTQGLIAGLKGAADLDRDGKISIDELYDYAYAQFVARVPGQPPSRFGDLNGSLALGYVPAQPSVPPRAPVAFRAPKVGSLISERYRLTAAFPEPAMFAATDERTSAKVTVKCLLPPQSIDATALERFLRDAQTAGALQHPNVVAIHDVGFEGNCAFVVMESLEGESLATLLKHKPQLEIAETLEIILPALEAAAAAHAKNIIHRALTPDTVFVNRHRDGSIAGVKVLGFGVSSVADASSSRRSGLIGSPQYMAPEQVLGDAPVDARTDVYAFGVMLYEALTGHRPFEADNHAAALWKLGNGEIRSPRSFCPTLPAALESIVLQAMARAPDERFASIEALRVALSRAMHEHGWMLTAEVIPAPAEVQRAKAAIESKIDTPAVFERPRRAPPSSSGSFSWTFAVSMAALALGMVGLLLTDPELFEEETPADQFESEPQPSAAAAPEPPPPPPPPRPPARSFEPVAPAEDPPPQPRAADRVEGTLTAPAQPLSPPSAANLMMREVDAGWIDPVPRARRKGAEAREAREAREAKRREREQRKAGRMDGGAAPAISRVPSVGEGVPEPPEPR